MNTHYGIFNPLRAARCFDVIGRHYAFMHHADHSTVYQPRIGLAGCIHAALVSRLPGLHSCIMATHGHMRTLCSPQWVYFKVTKLPQEQLITRTPSAHPQLMNTNCRLLSL